ncbi:MAG: nitronate monooxygenase, partial [Chloroflexi bacterium]|nr:nitronate monooxygenase [Chloroflexota bacterium]
PDLVNAAAAQFGSQAVVVAIDAKRVEKSRWQVFIAGGKIETHLDAIEWAREMAQRGAGEILLTSIDADGTQAGYDLELTRAVTRAVNIPVIASGGAGKLEDFAAVFAEGNASAALAASLFHFRQVSIPQVKNFLRAQKIPVRS